MNADSTPTAAKPKSHWFRLTPDRLLAALLALEGFLFLSERFRWFAFNERKGWTVLIAVASVGLAILLMSVCYAVSLVFRWRFQFSLRSLPVLVVVVAILCSWLAAEMRQAESQRQAVEAIKKLGGEVLYDYEFRVDNSVKLIRIAESPAPVWLRKMLGDDIFIDVSFVGFFVHFPRVTDAGLVNLKVLTRLQRLDLSNPQVTDAGLVNLRGLTRLEELDLDHTHVSDAGLGYLKGLTQLKNLVLCDTQITDAGLENLEGLTQLQFLDLSATNVTEAGLMKLQRALPKCKIEN